jgi:DNA-binding winged helix-turn-helix (wHTH) protein
MNSRERALTARFGRFLLDSHRRELLADGVPVPVGSRAFDVLTVLVEARGQLVTKDELASRVWPGRFIEDNCLQFQISALRKALAPDRDFIKTIPGRGYCFIADVSTHGEQDSVSVTPRGESPLSIKFPAALSDLIGQEATSTEHSDLVTARQPAARGDAGRTVEARPGTQSWPRVLPEIALPDIALPEIAKAWIATPGQAFAVPTVAAMLQLTDGGPANANGAGPAPKRLLLLLSIEPVVVGRRDRPQLTEETLPV